MGCTTSSVKPDKNEKNNNEIRGDRVSMLDARVKRDEDSRHHLKALSGQVGNQLDKAVKHKESNAYNFEKDSKMDASLRPQADSIVNKVMLEAHARIKNETSSLSLKNGAIKNRETNNVTPISICVTPSPPQGVNGTSTKSSTVLLHGETTTRRSTSDLCQVGD